MAQLALRSIAKTFGSTQVLSDCTFDVKEGAFTILLGPSGCGKSTLLRIIAGLEHASSGEVWIGGVSVGHLSPKDRDIAMVFQQYALYPHMTVRDNLAFGLKMKKKTPDHITARIREVAELLGITDLLHRKPRDLSGGQRQRVAIGRAIVRKPQLFLFDEPLSNLDARLRTSMRLELKKLHQALQATMVYVTHDQVEAMTLGDSIVILHEGRIQQIGTPEEIYHHPINPFVAGFIGNPAMNLFTGTLDSSSDALTLHAGPLTIPLPPQTALPRMQGSTPIHIGIRPEDIELEPSQHPSLAFTGKIALIEDLGADRLLHIPCGDDYLITRVSQQIHTSEHSAQTVYLPLHRFHLFADNQRISLSSQRDR